MNSSMKLASILAAGMTAGILIAPMASAQKAPWRPVASIDAPEPSQGDDGGLAGGTLNGPDVIVSSLAATTNVYAAVGGIAGYAITTVSCNLGDADAIWIDIADPNNPLGNQHPVIAQNMYRLKNGRFEQIGMSWLKHGWCAADAPSCGSPYEPNGSCDWLGTHATDTYSASLNAVQQDLGPRSEVNPWTGVFPYPYQKNWNLTGNSIFKRLQIETVDLDPALNAGSMYFSESQYVCTDEQPINRYNNVSYRRMIVGGATSGTWALSATGGTFTQQPAINAWKAADAQVVLRNIDVPDDGRMILGYRVTDNGDNTWHYEYALYNMNSDRAAQSFTLPLPSGVTVSNTGFHDVFYHSGETYSSVDWPVSTSSNLLAWATQPITENVNANAIRWGTMYNFRFDSPFPPKAAQAAVGLFKPGTENTLNVLAVGPTNCSADIAPGNGLGDGTVNVADLLAVISAWGACAMPTDCPADIAPPGGDDSVNVADLLAVVGAWGDCPN